MRRYGNLGLGEPEGELQGLITGPMPGWWCDDHVQQV